MSGLVIVFMAIILLAAPTTEAIVVDVPSGKVKCFTEELRKGALSYAQYVAVNASSGSKSHTISARVTDPHGDALHHTEGIESGEFYFEAAVPGRHTACFWSPRFELAASLSVDLEWRVGIRSRAGKEAAAAGGGTPLGMQLKQLEDAVGVIREEMGFLRDREMDAQRLGEETASRMASLTLCSLGVCLAVAFLQLWHLNTFFHAKKIL